MFAYKMAVVIKALGFNKIKIYNGGLKDWLNSGLPTEAIAPLADYEARFVSAEELYAYVLHAEENGCVQVDGKVAFTLLDIRTEPDIESDSNSAVITNPCETVTGILDDLQDESFRQKIPKDTPVFVITETGNRDVFAIRYLHTFGYSNIKGLKFGLRGWLMANLPTSFNNNK